MIPIRFVKKLTAPGCGLVLLLLLPTALLSARQEPESHQQKTAAGPAPNAPSPPTVQGSSHPATPAPTPFVPSEKIKADTVIAFPADI